MNKKNKKKREKKIKKVRPGPTAPHEHKMTRTGTEPKDLLKKEMRHGPDHVHPASHDLGNRFWISLGLTVPVLLFSEQVQTWFPLFSSFVFSGQKYVLLALSTIIFFHGGFPFFKGFFQEMKRKQLGMMMLVSMAIAVAYVYSTAVVLGLSGMDLFWELATLIDVMLLGHWLEVRAVASSSRSLEEMARLLPAKAHKYVAENKTLDVPPSQLAVHDRVLVKPGERIPADGAVANGESSIDESMLTGESAPVGKKVGSGVLAGSVNQEGALVIQVTKINKESYVHQLIKLVTDAQAGKSATQHLADRIALILTFTALGAGAAAFLVWFFFMDKGLAFSLERAVTILVIACPHALGLAIPLVVAVSAGMAARNGLLIKNKDAWEKIKRIKAVIFDKTGTLTQGTFGVTDIISLNKFMDENEVLKYAATVESRSSHPMAKGISSASPQIYRADEFRSIPGKGVEARVNAKNVKMVNASYLKKMNIKLSGTDLSRYYEQGKTILFLLIDSEVAGIIALSDMVRPEAKTAVSRLKKMGMKCIMMTGDHKETAQWVSEIIGIDEYYAEMLPAEKLKKVRELQAGGLSCAMTGDGINDAPALAQADLGIALGAGTDVAMETADVILVRSNPMDVLGLFNLGRASYGKMVQNLVWALGYNLLAIPLAAGILYPFGIIPNPAFGAILMSLSTLIVAINSNFIPFFNKKV